MSDNNKSKSIQDNNDNNNRFKGTPPWGIFTQGSPTSYPYRASCQGSNYAVMVTISVFCLNILVQNFTAGCPS
jgi:hypothetical protein